MGSCGTIYMFEGLGRVLWTFFGYCVNVFDIFNKFYNPLKAFEIQVQFVADMWLTCIQFQGYFNFQHIGPTWGLVGDNQRSLRCLESLLIHPIEQEEAKEKILEENQYLQLGKQGDYLVGLQEQVQIFLEVSTTVWLGFGLDLKGSCRVSIVISLYLAVTRKALQPGMLDENMMILL